MKNVQNAMSIHSATSAFVFAVVSAFGSFWIEGGPTACHASPPCTCARPFSGAGCILGVCFHYAVWDMLWAEPYARVTDSLSKSTRPLFSLVLPTTLLAPHDTPQTRGSLLANAATGLALPLQRHVDEPVLR
jgi:hypothetical protein